ncbi:M17 family metallopeptidase [Spiroplasma turonicum]|uniref:Probable cytosol aminopeptidase n=1 Tax=Spiroplasma turonicum TaxID=216946 RepID=A0A0K1P750_9MOLU|nr:M17 family metallopeptidase [Spiroplasma turonicum]AKU80024.1 leucyl aminopeptidase [Spiroplasma turonicum]ALX71026.1 leucyl aminopeptidase [Spiroplasma turonicum]
MLTFNKEKQELTLKLVHELKNPFINKKNGSVTLISEDKTLYMYIACSNESKPFKNCDCLRKLKEYLNNFISTNSYNINIDLDTFLEFYSDKKERAALTIFDSILYNDHKKISRKSNSSCESNYIYNLITTKHLDLESLFNESIIKMEFVNFARDLQDLPPNEGTAPKIAELIETKAKEVDGVKCTILTKKEIEKIGLNLLLAVNAASEIEPRVVILEYNNDSSKEKIGLVGKGITFDSGGYNLKGAAGLANMKFDMSGAAIVSSTVLALAKCKAKTNVVSISMLTDNRIGGHGTLTESIIKSYNGLTVQIDNTDAEGRLVLADGISYAVKDLKVDKVFDVATLTGAMRFSLGIWHTGVFTKYDRLWQLIEKSAFNQNELVWRLPMIWEHLEIMKSTPIADLTNTGQPNAGAGSSTAAAFLDLFAENKPYLHLDIATTAQDKGRGKAIMLKTLFELLKNDY